MAKARNSAVRQGLAPKAKAKRSPEQVELEPLRRRNERLEAELARTKTALEITGKAIHGPWRPLGPDEILGGRL